MSAGDFARARRRRFVRPVAIGAGALALAFVLTWWLTDFSQARTFLSDGDALYKAGRYSEAVTTLTTAISKRPRDPEGYRVRARAYIALTQYDQAKHDLDSLLNLRPNDADALGTRAALLITSQGCSQEAIADLTRALDIARSADAFARRGGCLLNLGKPAEAVKDLTRAMQLDPSSDHYLERATAFSAMNEHAAAIADLDKVIQERPDVPDPYRLRAREREKLGDTAGAAADRKKAADAAAAGALH